MKKQSVFFPFPLWSPGRVKQKREREREVKMSVAVCALMSTWWVMFLPAVKKGVEQGSVVNSLMLYGLLSWGVWVVVWYQISVVTWYHLLFILLAAVIVVSNLWYSSELVLWLSFGTPVILLIASRGFPHQIEQKSKRKVKDGNTRVGVGSSGGD
jgi:hypothetical protein